MFGNHVAAWAVASSILVSGCNAALLSGVPSKYRGVHATASDTAYTRASTPIVPGRVEEPTTALAVVSASGEAMGPSGSLAVDLELPATRGVQALPDFTEKVVIGITAARLASPVRQTILRSQFVGGKARLRIEKLPLGDVQIQIAVYGADDVLIASGTATSTVRPDTVTPVRLELVVKEKTGSIAIAVDSRTEYADTPVVSIPEAEPSPVPADDSPRVTLEPIKWRNHSRSGNLSSSDPSNPTRSGTYRDDYLLVGAQPGDTVSLEMSADFDAYLQVVDAVTGLVLYENDDGGQGNDAALTFTTRYGMSYIVRATSYRHWDTGAYTLTTTSR